MGKQVYPYEVRPMTPDEGEGWIVTYPDLPGCIATGKTEFEAIKEAKDAVNSYIKTSEEFGDPLPKPGEFSGKFRLRVPKSLHARLVNQAKQEEVSMNTLAVSILAAGIASGQSVSHSHHVYRKVETGHFRKVPMAACKTGVVTDYKKTETGRKTTGKKSSIRKKSQAKSSKK